MKAICLSLICCLLIGFGWATVTPFEQVGIGHFSGKLGIHTAGDTLAFVYNASRQSIPYDIGPLVMKRSFDAGQNWVSFTKPNLISNCQRPTLFWSPDEIMISYTSGFENQVAWSIDNGTTWEPLILGRTFEKSPYMERNNGLFKRFSLDLPYPELDQDSYSAPDQEELASPMMFVNNDETTNGTPTYFYGPDVIYGPVYANSDIWIKQAGGGINSGWPTFYAPVITAGEIHSFSGVIPYDQVFLGGYSEHAPTLEVPDTAPIRAHAQVIGPPAYDPNNILMVTVNGNTYSAMLGTIIPPVGREYAWVYASYPADPLGEPLYRNVYSVSDTLWTPLPDGNATGILFTPNKLWIRGNFSGAQTWCSGDTIMIIGDITLTNTTPGMDPSVEPVNMTDSVSLISEKSILLKYGYRDPVDSLRYHPLCRADGDPVHIYASLYALGDGQGVSQRDGVFSFEYQHPHPSLQAVNAWGNLWDNIDLHRRHFPQTVSAPWPSNIDYPWYNPLWPERIPYLERGTVQLWGSINQRRRGFLHRSLYDNEYPSNGVWNPDLDFCGGTSSVNYQDPVLGIPLATSNYPGTTGSGVGYKKDFHYDHRSSFWALDTPGGQESIWKLGMTLGTCTLYQDGWQTESYYRKTQVRKTHSKVFSRGGNSALYATNDLLLLGVGDEVTDFSASTYGDGMIQSVALAPDGTPLVYQYDTTDTDTMRLKL
ncbi:MAG TPA: hypothetical protein PKI15_01185, partial [Candidatus Cloacimonadota bacterium]|nr:hypothetical protein [Candidatus Cloacimonadota bacterium]